MRRLKRAKVPRICLHDFRDRRVRGWIAEGKPAALIQEAMGHVTITTTLGYSHLAREHLRLLVTDGSEPGQAWRSERKAGTA